MFLPLCRDIRLQPSPTTLGLTRWRSSTAGACRQWLPDAVAKSTGWLLSFLWDHTPGTFWREGARMLFEMRRGLTFQKLDLPGHAMCLLDDSPAALCWSVAT